MQAAGFSAVSPRLQSAVREDEVSRRWPAPGGAGYQAFRAYVRDRYGTATRAKAFWQANGWY